MTKINRQCKPVPLLLGLIVISSVVVGTAVILRRPVLQVVASGGRVLYERTVSPGDEFGIVFTHSVAKTPVEERFRIAADNSMLLYETVYQDFGAGLPSEADEGAVMELGPFGIKITGIQRVIHRIPLRIGRTTKQQIVFGDNTIDLTTIAEPGERVDILVAPQWRGRIQL
ncbi:MAG: DUF1850 domain-containing protein [Firmicutes bacterium]|nr:DUF1850 domain-containing protein [Bacillota bacterium]MDD4335944.1 DUF1850 domain-containing protein [Bacillota bacterium]